MNSVLEFEKHIKQQIAAEQIFSNFKIYSILKPLEFEGWGYYNNNTINVTELNFVLSATDTSELDKLGNTAEYEDHKEEIYFEALERNKVLLFIGITDSFAGPMSYDHSIGYYDFRGEFIIFYNKPDDSGPRLSAYMDRESFLKNKKKIIEEIFLTKGKVIDTNAPFLHDGIWDVNEFYNAFDLDFVTQILFRFIEKYQLWGKEKEKMIEYLAIRSGGASNQMQYKLEKLNEILTSSSTYSDNTDSEMELDEKITLLSNILAHRIKIDEN